MVALVKEVRKTVALFKRKAFTIRTIEEQSNRSASGHEMHRVYGAFSLFMLGVGCIVGAGVFVLTGVAARKYAGPAVVVSYAVSGISAALAALCYAEYAADVPCAGGAFNYVSLTFGEFAAWITACDLILEYTLSASAVAKGLTSYVAALFSLDIKHLRYQSGIVTLDPFALGCIVLITIVLVRGSAVTSNFNLVVTGLNVVLILFVLFAAFPFVKTENYTPFAPFGVRGIFSGASITFFSFIGFDTVATAAEEVRNPARDLPLGILGSLAFCTALYVLMCLAVTGMSKYTLIDLDAPFAAAFASTPGMSWAGRVVAAGALTGIVTSLLGALLGQSRIYVVLGRQGLLPKWLARIDSRRGTPANAQLVTMVTAGILALLVETELLAQLVSIGTLVVFCVVCSGVLFRRYHVRGVGYSSTPVTIRILLIAAGSFIFSTGFTERLPTAVPAVGIGLWLLATISFLWLPVQYVPKSFRCPCIPFVPSAGMLCTLHLVGSLGWPAYVRWITCFLIGTGVYLAYGVRHSVVGGDAGGAAGGREDRQHVGVEDGGEALLLDASAADRPGHVGDDALAAEILATELTTLNPRSNDGLGGAHYYRSTGSDDSGGGVTSGEETTASSHSASKVVFSHPPAGDAGRGAGTQLPQVDSVGDEQALLSDGIILLPFNARTGFKGSSSGGADGGGDFYRSLPGSGPAPSDGKPLLAARKTEPSAARELKAQEKKSLWPTFGDRQSSLSAPLVPESARSSGCREDGSHAVPFDGICLSDSHGSMHEGRHPQDSESRTGAAGRDFETGGGIHHGSRT